MTKVYFVRHGRSEANESKVKRHIIWDAPLHKIGVRQAALLREYFRGIYLDLCIVSPLRRAIQTALLALGAWETLQVGCKILRAQRPSQELFEAASRTAIQMEEAIVTKVATTVQVEYTAGKDDANSTDGSTAASSSVRFDASDDDVEPLASGQSDQPTRSTSSGHLGPGSKVRIRKHIGLQGGTSVKEDSVGTVTNSTLTTRSCSGELQHSSSHERHDHFLNVVTESLCLPPLSASVGGRSCDGEDDDESMTPANFETSSTTSPSASALSSSAQAATSSSSALSPTTLTVLATTAAAARLPYVQAWPSVRERLVESDDLGSSSAVLKSWYPCVDFSKLPAGDQVWWYAPSDPPAAHDPVDCRPCWEKEDYEEPESDFQARVSTFLADLERAASEQELKTVAVFAHCWTLEEVWRQRFGRAYTFSNAEVAVVDISKDGSWRWLKEER